MSGREYKRVAERAQEGSIALVEPLDYMILEQLPEQGTTLGGLVPLGGTVRDLKNTTFKSLPNAADTLGGRLRALEAYGMVVSVVMPGSSRGWQRTPFGQKTLKSWQNDNQEKEDK